MNWRRVKGALLAHLDGCTDHATNLKVLDAVETLTRCGCVPGDAMVCRILKAALAAELHAVVRHAAAACTAACAREVAELICGASAAARGALLEGLRGMPHAVPTAVACIAARPACLRDLHGPLHVTAADLRGTGVLQVIIRDAPYELLEYAMDVVGFTAQDVCAALLEVFPKWGIVAAVVPRLEACPAFRGVVYQYVGAGHSLERLHECGWLTCLGARAMHAAMPLGSKSLLWLMAHGYVWEGRALPCGNDLLLRACTTSTEALTFLLSHGVSWPTDRADWAPILDAACDANLHDIAHSLREALPREQAEYLLERACTTRQYRIVQVMGLCYKEAVPASAVQACLVRAFQAERVGDGDAGDPDGARLHVIRHLIEWLVEVGMVEPTRALVVQKMQAALEEGQWRMLEFMTHGMCEILKQ